MSLFPPPTGEWSKKELDPEEKSPMADFLKNNKVVVDDTVYEDNTAHYQEILSKKPWRRDDRYFQKCKMSLLALTRILQHAKKGGDIEIMGYFKGTIVNNTYVVTDAFPLPVEGTETRVNAGQEAEEYTGSIGELSEAMKKTEQVLGWYHSHPNYGPWLSGIDVQTQKSMQMMGPMLAIVVDPIRTEISGKVDIGAFRTCMPNEKNQIEGDSIPEEKMRDFGLYHNHYYKLEMEYFVSTKDFEIIEYSWTSFWKSILESDKLIQNKADITKSLIDIASKSSKFKSQCRSLANIGAQKATQQKEADKKLKEFTKFAAEITQSVHQDCVKALAFNSA